MKPSDAIPEGIARIAALEDRTRRRVYEYVAAQTPTEVSRDQVADVLGISRSLAAFHLDRLVEARLLVADFRRLGGRRGPGAGRPSKLYRRSESEVDVSLPPRQYLLLARLLTHAIAHDPSDAAREMLGAGAERLGHEIAANQRPAKGRSGRPHAAFRSIAHAVQPYGFEPAEVDGRLRLRNCPFHALAQEHPETVCEMNLCLMRGVADGLQVKDARPVLAPEQPYCCVVFEPDSSPTE